MTAKGSLRVTSKPSADGWQETVHGRTETDD